MGKAKLKAVEATLERQLEVAIEEEAAARQAVQAAEKRHEEEYGADSRLTGRVVVVPPSTSLSDEQRLERAQAEHVREQDFWEYRRLFLESAEELAVLRHSADTAYQRMNRLKLDVEQQVDEKKARDELATTITAVSAAEAELSRLSAAVGRAAESRRNAEVAIRSAEASLAEATENQARLYEAAIEQGHPAGRDGSVQDARARLDDARDELAAARSATEALTEKKAQAERKLAGLRERIERFARQIAATAVPRLLAAARAAQADLEGQRIVLSFLQDFSPDLIGAVVEEYLSATVFTWGHRAETHVEHPAVAPWLRAIEGLTTDASTALPKG